MIKTFDTDALLTKKPSKEEMLTAYRESRANSIYEFDDISEEEAKTELFEDAFQIASSYNEKAIRLDLSMHMALKRKV